MAADRMDRPMLTLADVGAATAEYIVGTVAAAGFATVLVQFLKSPVAHNLLWMIMRKALGLD